MEHMNDADLILYVVDSSVPLTEEDETIIQRIKEKKAIVLLNKSDLNMIVTKKQIEEKLSHPVVLISAKNEHGIKNLEETVQELFFQGEISFNDEVYITNMRHKVHLEETEKSLQMVLESIDNQMPEDFFQLI